MSDTTLTFSIFNDQTPVEFVDDPSKPGWEDFLAGNAPDERDDDEQESEERWDQLLASPKSQSLLKKMAAEALEEDRAGLTKDLIIDEL